MSYPDYIALTIGHAGRLNRQALREAVRRTEQLIAIISPLTAIDFCISGYDDDPREIYEIPEARHFVIDFAAGLVKAGIPAERLLPLSRQLVQVCIAAEEGIDVTITGDVTDIDIGKEIEAHRERARKKMQ